MSKYLRKRLLQIIPVLFIVTVVVFVLVNVTGDPTATMLPADAPAAARENLRGRWGWISPYTNSISSS